MDGRRGWVCKVLPCLPRNMISNPGNSNATVEYRTDAVGVASPPPSVRMSPGPALKKGFKKDTRGHGVETGQRFTDVP